MDERLKTLAHNLVSYSCRVQPGEKVYIEYIGHDTTDLARLLVKRTPGSSTSEHILSDDWGI